MDLVHLRPRDLCRRTARPTEITHRHVALEGEIVSPGMIALCSHLINGTKLQHHIEDIWVCRYTSSFVVRTFFEGRKNELLITNTMRTDMSVDQRTLVKLRCRLRRVFEVRT